MTKVINILLLFESGIKMFSDGIWQFYEHFVVCAYVPAS